MAAAKSGITAPIKPAVWDEAVRLLGQGYNITEITEMDGMPSEATFYRNIDANPDLERRIARARELGWDRRAERVAKEAVAAGDAALGRLALDANRWLLAKMNPRKYGDKVQTEISGPDGGPIAIGVATADLPTVIADILKAAADRADKDGSDLA